jgi:uncharacterized protein
VTILSATEPIGSLHAPEVGPMKSSVQLFRALADGRLDRIATILRRGASQDSRDEHDTPALVVAVRMGNAEAVRLLVEAGADVNPRVRHHCERPIMAALQCRDPAIFLTLLGRGAFPGPFEGYASAFSDAVGRGRREIVRALLNHGFGVDAPLATGLTPLIEAAREGHAAIVGDLLDAGATVDLTDESGRTALCWAIVYNVEADESEHIAQEAHCEVIEHLLAAGADPSRRDVKGKSILSWALQRGDPKIVQLLKAGSATE